MATLFLCLKLKVSLLIFKYTPLFTFHSQCVGYYIYMYFEKSNYIKIERLAS